MNLLQRSRCLPKCFRSHMPARSGAALAMPFSPSRLMGRYATVRATAQATKVNLMSTLEYRGGFLIWALEDLISPLISLAVWLAVSEHTAQLPLSRTQFVLYFLLVGVLSTLTNSWLIYLLPDEIRTGRLSPLLLRPVSPLVSYVGNNVGQKIVRVLLLLPLVGGVSLLFRDELRLPTEGATWLLFGAALVMAAFVSFLFDLAQCSLAFWLQDTSGLYRFTALAERLLQGRFIPLAMFPQELQGFVEVQPFRYMLSFPLEILTGSLTADAVVRGVAWQVGYGVVFYALYRLLWRYGLRAYSAAGA